MSIIPLINKKYWLKNLSTNIYNTIDTVMLRLISKNKYTNQYLNQINKFARLTLQYDGSVSRAIESLSSQKLSVKLLHQQSFEKGKFTEDTLRNPAILHDNQLVVRSTELKIPKLGTLLFARSFWSKHAYGAIMSKNPNRAIGFNLIDQKVEQFREMHWLGEASLKVNPNFTLLALSRSYSIHSKGELLCQVEQYYTPFYQRLFD